MPSDPIGAIPVAGVSVMGGGMAILNSEAKVDGAGSGL